MPPPITPEAIRERAEAIAYERGSIEDSWSSGHSCGSYGCCGGGKEIDRDELARVIADALARAEQEATAMRAQRDQLVANYMAGKALDAHLRALRDGAQR
jgi:hypothetical protein